MWDRRQSYVDSLKRIRLNRIGAFREEQTAERNKMLNSPVFVSPGSVHQLSGPVLDGACHSGSDPSGWHVWLVTCDHFLALRPVFITKSHYFSRYVHWGVLVGFRNWLPDLVEHRDENEWGPTVHFNLKKSKLLGGFVVVFLYRKIIIKYWFQNLVGGYIWIMCTLFYFPSFYLTQTMLF